MARNADETRRKLFDASVREFAEHGIAGARVDRITTTAGVNNALLYRYFGNKSELFDTVFATLATQLVDAVPFAADDLVGYAGALVDHYTEHPDIVRITAWYQLEHADRPPPETIVASLADKARRITDAQAAGHVTTAYPAAELLGMIFNLASLATDLAPPGAYTGHRASPEDRRNTVITAVAALLAARPTIATT